MNTMKPNIFDWDEGNLGHTAKHGMTPSEIEYVLSNDPMVKPDRYPAEIEERWNAIGQTQEGRHAFIVFTFREVEEVLCMRPISARYMRRKEIERYDRQNPEG